METANFWSTWLGRSPASSTEPLRKEFQPVAEPIAQPLDVEREQPAKVPQPTLTVPEEPVTVADPLTASVPAGAAPDYDNLNSVLILWGRLPAILEEVQWKEMWGIQLDATNHAHAPTRVVLFKFLTARHDNVEKAAEMLKKSLLWRKETRPRSLLEVPYHPRFEALGCVSKHTLDDGSNKPVVVTWNLWSNMKNNDREILAHVDAYINWRIALIELSIDQLDMAAATHRDCPVSKATDKYKIIQVHDFTGIRSRQLGLAHRKLIRVWLGKFADNYPNLTGHKEFVAMPWLVSTLLGSLKVLGCDLLKDSGMPKIRAGLRDGLPRIQGQWPHVQINGPPGDSVPCLRRPSVATDPPPAGLGWSFFTTPTSPSGVVPRIVVQEPEPEPKPQPQHVLPRADTSITTQHHSLAQVQSL